MKKVLFILDDLSGGGAERVFVNIANDFVCNNIEVEFLVGNKRGIYLDILNPFIPIREVGGPTLLKYLTTFPRFFTKNKYTHIFTASHYASTAAIISKKITGQPGQIFLTHHYTLPGTRALKYFKGDLVLKCIHFFITPYADKIIAVSRGSLEWLRRFSHHKLQQGTYIHNPVFDDTIYSLAIEPIQFPIEIKDKILLLNVGRMVEAKDQITLIKAFCILKQTYANAALFILGVGPLQTKIQNCINENGMNSCIFLMGFQANPYKWMAKCDVLISSSIYEGFGNVLVEAMALGKTVVSTDCPSGPGEILNNGELGYLCAVKDPAELAKAISKGLTSPIDKDLLKKSSQQYTINNILKKYYEIL